MLQMTLTSGINKMILVVRCTNHTYIYIYMHINFFESLFLIYDYFSLILYQIYHTHYNTTVKHMEMKLIYLVVTYVLCEDAMK